MAGTGTPAPMAKAAFLRQPSGSLNWILRPARGNADFAFTIGINWHEITLHQQMQEAILRTFREMRY